MAPEAVSDTSHPCGSPPAVGGVPTPVTPGVWAVSHLDIDRVQARNAQASGRSSSFELVTEVTFLWSYPAKSAFVTGTFSNWETTVPMTLTQSPDGPVWILSKALPRGDYQYKFIIDNVWRHAPDQPIAFDERGIINNVLSVTVEPCGDVTCFCTSFFDSEPAVAITKAGPESRIEQGVMTPKTIKRFQRNIGVAYRYVERDNPRILPFRKAYMHTEISDRPFDVTVVNVNNLKSAKLMDEQTIDGTMSRASSFEKFDEIARYDPNVPVVEDAAYAATLNDMGGSFPHTAPYRANLHSSDPTELAYSVRARLSSPVFGFNPNECHEGIRLTDTNHCAVRVQERGLYKTVRGVLPVRQSQRRIYYEFFIFRQATGGGVCIGLSTHELPLNCLCGTRPNSVGFSTSGNLVQTIDGKETWRDFGEELQSGCTVGCLVSMKDSSGGEGNRKAARKASTEFFVDGKSKGTVDYEFVGDLDVFPTLSLFARHARVYSLFNGQDMLYASCLPANEEILTLDGRTITRDAGNTPKSLGFAAKHGNGASKNQE